MKLEEFNKLTETRCCWVSPEYGSCFRIQPHEAREWALESINESKRYPRRKRFRPRFFLDGEDLIIGFVTKWNSMEVTP